MYLSLEDYRRRMLGCWIGKNVGGTLGMPMEWNRQPNDVTYYTHKMTGEPLPNDDLDIQVLWLLALEDKGLDIDCKVLGQYFNELMIFTHGEYGTAKTNLRAGLQPPARTTTTSRIPAAPSSVRKSGPASSPAIRKRPRSMPSRTRWWITATARAFTPKCLSRRWKRPASSKPISAS